MGIPTTERSNKITKRSSLLLAVMEMLKNQAKYKRKKFSCSCGCLWFSVVKRMYLCLDRYVRKSQTINKNQRQILFCAMAISWAAVVVAVGVVILTFFTSFVFFFSFRVFFLHFFELTSYDGMSQNAFVSKCEETNERRERERNSYLKTRSSVTNETKTGRPILCAEHHVNIFDENCGRNHELRTSLQSSKQERVREKRWKIVDGKIMRLLCFRILYASVFTLRFQCTFNRTLWQKKILMMKNGGRKGKRTKNTLESAFVLSLKREYWFFLKWSQFNKTYWRPNVKHVNGPRYQYVSIEKNTNIHEKDGNKISRISV